MIQRIQSLWLFLAAMINGLLFLFPLYRYNFAGLLYAPWQVERAVNFMPLFILAALVTMLPLIAIFFFGNRKRQRGLVVLSMVSVFAFLSVMMMHVSNLKNGTPTVAHFEYLLPGFLVTIVALVFEVLALRGIRKDDKLIKSLDRLR